MRLCFVLVLLLATQIAMSGRAMAASFDCKRAATAVERQICADPALSKLDDRAFAAYNDAAEALGLKPDDKNPLSDLLLRGHQEWTAARDRCGAASGCLLTQYLRRIGVLNFNTDPQAKSPVDPFVGRYEFSVEPVRTLVIMRGPENVALVRVTVTGKDFSCDFSGVGHLDGGGNLRVTREDFDGTKQGPHTLLLTPSRVGLVAKRADPRDDISSKFCDAGGSLEQPFPRR